MSRPTRRLHRTVQQGTEACAGSPSLAERKGRGNGNRGYFELGPAVAFEAKGGIEQTRPQAELDAVRVGTRGVTL